MSLGAHHIGPVALIETGSEISSRSRRLGDGDDEFSSSAVGGVVITTVEDANEDGDVRTGYLVMDPYRTRPKLYFDVLAESDVDFDMVKPPNTSRMASLLRRLCEEIAFSGPHKRRTGPVTTRDKDLLANASHLMAAIFCAPVRRP